MTRVKTSSRPVELLGLVAAHRSARQRQAFQQRRDVDAARLQHGALRQADGVQLQIVELGRNPLAAARQEAGAHAVGDVAQTQVEARRLQLVGQQRLGELHLLADDQLADRLRRQDALGGAPLCAAFAALTSGLAIVVKSLPASSALSL